MAHFSKYIEAVGENCVNKMLPKWENRLGGAGSSCQLIALPWLSCESYNPNSRHYSKTIRLYTNKQMYS